jgi:hypothetical protein
VAAGLADGVRTEVILILADSNGPAVLIPPARSGSPERHLGASVVGPYLGRGVWQTLEVWGLLGAAVEQKFHRFRAAWALPVLRGFVGLWQECIRYRRLLPRQAAPFCTQARGLQGRQDPLRFCAGFALVLRWFCAGFALVLRWFCTSYAQVLHAAHRQGKYGQICRPQENPACGRGEVLKGLEATR